MGVSGWGGTSAFIQEGLRRAEEDRKRKEEEERRRAEEERRRASVVSPIQSGIDAWRGQTPIGPPTREQAGRGRPNISVAQPGPLIGITNPNRVDTSTPQIGASQPTQQTVMSVVEPVTPAVQGPIQNPRRTSINALSALNTGVPSLNVQSPIPGALPQIAGQLAPAIQTGLNNLNQVGPGIAQGLGELWRTGAEAALQIPGLGPLAADLATPFAPILPETAQQTIQNRQRQADLDRVAKQEREGDLTRWQGVDTPLGAVIERYRYNLLDKPQDAADQLLRQFVPVVYGLLKGTEAMGLVDEAALSIPGSGALLGDPSKTLGEAWGTGVRAQQIYNQQYSQYLTGQEWQTDGPWWKFNALQGTPVKKQVSAPDMLASIAMATDEYLANFVPTAEQLRTSSPAMIAAAIAQARGMAHHGIAAVAQQFDDILELEPAIKEKRDRANALYQTATQLPPGQEREQLLWEAAKLGAEAKQLAHTHPAQLFDKNANWWMALPAEVMLGGTNLLDIGTTAFKLTPKARRFAQGERLVNMTVEQAAQAMQSGIGIGRTAEQAFRDTVNAIPLLNKWWQTNASRAAVDGRNNFRTLTSLAKEFTTKEDLRRIIKAYVTDPIELLINGIPANELTSPAVKFMFPNEVDPVVGPIQNIVRFGPADFAQYAAVKSQPSLQYMAPLIDTMQSLAGEGPAHFAEWAPELYTMLTRAAGERFGVATLAGVPAAAKHATTMLTGDGLATVQYKAAEKAKEILFETAPMAIAQANKAVFDFKKYYKSGQEYAANALEEIGNTQRSALGVTTLYASLRNVINDAISNRTIATADGVWSWKGYDKSLEFIQGIYGGNIPYDEVARQVATDMTTHGNIGTMFSAALNKGPFAAIRNLRTMDEAKTKTIVYSRVTEEFVNGAGWRTFKPAVENFLKSSGWADPKEIKNAVNAVFDAGTRGGWAAAANTFYQIANGSNPSSVATYAPHYRDIYGELAGGLDNIVKSVTPDSVDNALAQLDTLYKQARTNLSAATQGYVFEPGRTNWTRLDDQKSLAELRSDLETVANVLGEDFATGVQPYLEQWAGIQRTINDNVYQLLQMAGSNPNAANHVWALWNRVTDLRTQTFSALDQIGDDLLGSTRTMLDDEKRVAYNEYRMMKDAYFGLLNYDTGEAIDEARRLIAEGVEYVGSGAIGRVLEDLAYDPNTVFNVNKLKPGAFKADPNARAAEEAGHRGTQMFLTQMTALLQQNFTPSGFDHLVSALDDAGEFFNRNVQPILGQMDEMGDRLRALNENDAGWPAIKREIDRLTKTRNEAYTKYYEFAYGRYQAASAFIVQNANGIANLPVFKPAGQWGLANWGQDFTVIMMGINFRNPKEVFVRVPGGRIMGMPKMFVPTEAMAQWDKAASDVYTQLAQQVTKLGANLFAQGTGSEVIDGLIRGIRESSKNPIFDAVRDDMAQYMANPQAYGDLGGDMTTFLGKQIDNIAATLRSKMGEIAERNVRKVAPLGLDQVRRFNSELKPLWDNILAGAGKAAEEMVSFSQVDFANKYGPDALAGLFVPYSYWATRQGKNMLERMLFSPRFFGYVANASKVIQSEARDQGLPQRYNNAINTGYTIPVGPMKGEKLMIGNPIPRWAPFGVRYIFSGWGDVDRANQASEVLLNQMAANGFPGVEGIASALLFGSEMGSALGVPQYPWQKAAILAANGREGEIDLSMFGWLGQMGGLAYGAAGGQYKQFVNAFYEPYKAARDVANQYFGESDEGMPVLAAGQAQFEGRETAPEFQAAHPAALADWQQAYREQTLESFIFGLLGGATSLNLSSMDPNEPARLEAQRTYSDMGWSPENPTGSRERTQALDSNSPNYVPGLAAGQATYQVIGEGPQRESITPSPDAWPYMPPYETRKLDEGIVLGEYLDKRTAIFDRYKAEETEMINANPQWTGEKVDSARSDWYGDFYDRRTAEIEALDAEYPTVAGKFSEKTAANLRGANPLETTTAALDRLIQQARDENADLDPGDYPEGGSNEETYSWNKQNDAYQLAVTARLQELMNDPQAASQAVFNRPLDMEGPMEGQPSPRVGPADAADAGTGKAVVGQQPGLQAAAAVAQAPTGAATGVDPNNQWATQMSAAEEANGLPPGLLQEVARGESNFNPDATSDAGAMGILQIMPKTWEEWAPKVGATDPYSAEDNIAVSAAYLGWLSEQLPAGQQDIRSLMIAYNWGIGNVLEKGIEKAPPESVAYAQDIAAAVGDGSVMSGMTTIAEAGGQQFIRPVEGGSELVSQGYGANVEEYRAWNDEYGHEGIDYGVPVGTAVMAAAGGTVVFAGTGNGFDNYGNYVVIDHGNGYKSYYAHLDSFDAKVGDTVEQGQAIALSGNSGRSTGPHLHFALQKEGDTSGPYGMVDPTDFILGQDRIVSDTDTTIGDTVSLTIQPDGNKSGINWGVGSAEQALTQEANQYKSPEKIALDQSIEDAWAHSEARIASTYPDYNHLFEEYRGVNDEDRPDWRNANPMIRALNLLVYNEKEWEYVEKTWGEGMVEKWANIPRGANVSEAAGDYYRQYPDVFGAKAWIQGRPRPYDEDAEYDPTASIGRDFGKDYETAKEMFGGNIWDIVREYYTIPRYVRGGNNTAWIAFKEKYPQYDQWQDWWYALMGDQQATTAGYGFGRGYSSGSYDFGSFTPRNSVYVDRVEAQRPEPPRWQGAPSSGGDWRKYMELSRLGVKNPGH